MTTNMVIIISLWLLLGIISVLTISTYFKYKFTLLYDKNKKEVNLYTIKGFLQLSPFILLGPFTAISLFIYKTANLFQYGIFGWGGIEPYVYKQYEIITRYNTVISYGHSKQDAERERQELIADHALDPTDLTIRLRVLTS